MRSSEDVKITSWKVWYDDGSCHEGVTWDDWCRLAEARPNFGLVKMLYCADGVKQIQQADWWYEAQHPKGVIRATCNDSQKEVIEKKYPDAVFVEGHWTVDEWFYEIVNKAMGVKPEEDCGCGN